MVMCQAVSSPMSNKLYRRRVGLGRVLQSPQTTSSRMCKHRPGSVRSHDRGFRSNHEHGSRESHEQRWRRRDAEPGRDGQARHPRAGPWLLCAAFASAVLFAVAPGRTGAGPGGALVGADSRASETPGGYTEGRRSDERRSGAGAAGSTICVRIRRRCAAMPCWPRSTMPSPGISRSSPKVAGGPFPDRA